MGLVTRFSPSHIAQFWRDSTAVLGYRSVDQNGGFARAGADRALVTECHPALGPISQGSRMGAGDG
jgi:hypothetical protein